MSLVLMTLDHRWHHLESVRAALAFVASPLQYLVDAPSATGHWLGEVFASRQSLQEENDRLKARALLLEGRLQKMAALEAENQRLRALLDSSFKVGERVLVAEILEVDLEPFSQQIIINKGHRDEVTVGQPLLDASGVVGQVVHVAPFTSTAMLISDASHALPVRVNRSGLRAIAVGTGSSARLELLHLPVNADIEVGDLLVTSGLGGSFPPGYPVAVVEKVERDAAEAFATVVARPVAKLDQSREVLLVWTPPQTQPCGPDTTPCPEPAAAEPVTPAPAEGQ